MQQSPVETPGKRLPYLEFVIMVAALMALNAMAIDIMLPTLQQMGASLSVTDENARQLPISAYILAFGVSHLIYGPVSDHYGRRPVLLLGLAMYSLACIAGAAATSFNILLAMRALQGLGAGATRVIAVAVIRDTYSGRKMASVMSLAMMVFMAVPIFAPTIGQGIAMLAGWRAILIVIAATGLAMMVWCSLRLPETLHEENRRSLRPKPVLEAFRIVLTNRTAFSYAVATALIFGCMFAFLNSAQQVYQETYHLGALFPIAFSSAAVFIGVASFSNARQVERFGMRRLSHGALVGFAVVAAILAGLAVLYDGMVPFWAFYVLVLAAFCQFGFIGTNFNALAMEPLGHVAGTASSVVGAMQTLIGGVIGASIGYAYDGTVLPLALGMLVLSLMSIAVVAMGERGRLFHGAPIAAPARHQAE